MEEETKSYYLDKAREECGAKFEKIKAAVAKKFPRATVGDYWNFKLEGYLFTGDLDGNLRYFNPNFTQLFVSDREVELNRPLLESEGDFYFQEHRFADWEKEFEEEKKKKKDKKEKIGFWRKLKGMNPFRTLL